MKNEWKSIESAPKDGTVILVLRGKTILPVHWELGCWMGEGKMGMPISEATPPEFWMPLPDPPRKPVTFTKEQKEWIKKWVEANKREEEIGSVVCLEDSDGLIAFIDALPE